MTSIDIYKPPEISSVDDLFMLERNVLALLRARGVELSDWEEVIIKEEDEQYSEYEEKKELFVSEMGANITKYRQKMTKLYPYSSKRGGIYVYFEKGELGAKPSKADVDRFITLSNVAAASAGLPFTAMYITPGTLNKMELELLAEGSDLKTKYEVYLHNTLLVSRQYHVMNPVAHVMTEKQKIAFYTKCGLTATKLDKYPRAKYTQDAWDDPQVLYNNLQPGDLVKLVQKNNYTTQVVSKSISYRVVS